MCDWMRSGYKTTAEFSCPDPECVQKPWEVPGRRGETGWAADREEDTLCPTCGKEGS